MIDKIYAPGSCVDMEEFMASIKILMANALSQPDTVATLYHCENDCAYCYKELCIGEMSVGISDIGETLCPYYTVEDK